MPLRRTVVFPLDDTPACTARSQFAMQLARDHRCHLVGLAPTGLVEVPEAARRDILPAVSGLRARRILRDRAAASARRFQEAGRLAGVASFETRVDESDPASSVLRHANCADLVVLTQEDPASPFWSEERHLLERVLLESARPTVVLPRAGEPGPVGRRLLVAWDDSREAARAAADALPFLAGAERVELVWWREGPADGHEAAAHARLEAVYRWLQRHGVTSHVHAETLHGPVAEAIRSRARQMAADLIVMGAYGHARWLERVFGGATRDILSSMPLPVFMSR